MGALGSNAKSRRGALCRSPRGSHGPSTSPGCVARFRPGPSLAAGGGGALRERLQSPAPTSASKCGAQEGQHLRPNHLRRRCARDDALGTHAGAQRANTHTRTTMADSSGRHDIPRPAHICPRSHPRHLTPRHCPALVNPLVRTVHTDAIPRANSHATHTRLFTRLTRSAPSAKPLPAGTNLNEQLDGVWRGRQRD